MEPEERWKRGYGVMRGKLYADDARILLYRLPRVPNTPSRESR